MSAADSLVGEIKDVLDGVPASRRISILRDMTELFLDGAGLYSKQQIAIFGAVLIAITEHSERDELIELASKLAPIASAPPALMRKLASNPDIKVSGALLQQPCASLSDDDIAEIAATATPAQLQAIANRPEPGESITDALINRGDIEILRKCVSNERARIACRLREIDQCRQARRHADGHGGVSPGSSGRAEAVHRHAARAARCGWRQAGRDRLASRLLASTGRRVERECPRPSFDAGSRFSA
jgi:uncharacterized protein (DUF2336 family)